jgi:protein ImuB
MLWLSLLFPQFPLEVLAVGSMRQASAVHTGSVAVIADEKILVVDATAREAGVAPGMRLAAAWARQPQLIVLERRSDLEAATLKRLACWAGGFTPDVCLCDESSLLLEIEGCLRLFGGLETLLNQILVGLAAQGFAVRHAIAPTPMAANWLAQVGGDKAPCLDAGQVRQVIADLPVAVLASSPEIAARIHAFGLQRIGDLLALPRAALMRRIGAAPLLALSKALGELPDLRQRFVFPDQFCETLELPSRIEHAGALLYAGQRLVAALCGWLANRASGVATCLLYLEHERGRDKAESASCIELRFAEPTRDPSRITRVLRERLERLRLPSSVLIMRLEATSAEALPGRDGQLFSRASSGAGSSAMGAIGTLVERLQARLGEGSVMQLEPVADHRPECASRLVPWSAIDDPTTRRRATNGVGAPRSGHPAMQSSPAPTGEIGPHADTAPRPLWLLPKPEALNEINGRPQRYGPLELMSGPERIESGWWDAQEQDAVGDVQRDYFVARSTRYEWLWIFRAEAGWFLHGVFA